MNFYEITLAFLDQYAKTFDDIDWIGSKDFTISKDNFREAAERIRDNMGGFPAEEIPEDIVLVGKDFWIERNLNYESERDYSLYNCWVFKTKPTKPNCQKEVTSLFLDPYDKALIKMNSNTSEYIPLLFKDFLK